MHRQCRIAPGSGGVGLRYAKLGPDDKPVDGMFRDSANAAWLSLLYADMPGVSALRQGLARCLAKQTVEFILGNNAVQLGGSAGVSFQVGSKGLTCASACALCVPCSGRC
jgi:hypothetical protein